MNNQPLITIDIVKRQHSQDCLQAFGAYHLALQWYARTWPKYCLACQGRGVFVSSYDPSPAGVSLGSGSMTESEPCIACLEKGICPRCARMSILESHDSETYYCGLCGWVENKLSDVAPQQPECYCGEQQS